MTFADYAELIWAKEGTQAEIGAELGWSDSKVANFAALRWREKNGRFIGIAPEAWAVILTVVRTSLTSARDGEVDEEGKVVRCSERLLRHILQLTAEQQLELVTLLARGRNRRGHPFGKAASRSVRRGLDMTTSGFNGQMSTDWSSGA